MHLLKGICQTLWYEYGVLAPKRGVHLLVTIGFLISAGFRISRGGWPPAEQDWVTLVLYAGAVLSLLYSAIRLICALVTIHPLHIESYLEVPPKRRRELDSIYPSPEEEKSSYETISNRELPGEAMVISHEVNEAILDGKLNPTLVVESTLPSRIRNALRLRQSELIPILRRQMWDAVCHRKRFVNEKKLGMASNLLLDSGEVSAFRTDYYTSFLTNGLAVRRVRKWDTETRSFYDAFPEFPKNTVGQRNYLKGLGEYLAANHIGVSVIGVTKDKYICLWHQTRKTQFSELRLAPTGSGSLDFVDLNTKSPSDLRGLSLFEAVRQGMKRELKEECNRNTRVKDGVKIEDLKEPIILGFLRNVQRAGKPEFVGLCAMKVSHTSLVPSWEGTRIISEREQNYFPVKTIKDLADKVEEMLMDPHLLEVLSIPLHGNLLALKEAIVRRGQIIEEYLGY